MVKTLKKLLDILSDGEFHSGEQLGKVLNITRSAIWKNIRQLSDFNLIIEAIPNKGYRLKDNLQLLQSDKILSCLESDLKNRFAHFEILDTVSSTNDYLLNTLSQSPKENKICFAERQSHGKGRQGRVWVSPFAKNICLSLLWQFPKDPSTLSGLSLAIAVSIIETLNALGFDKNLGIKWPNDILFNHQKLAGILIEQRGEAHNHCSAVIGVGLNVNMPDTNHYDIAKPWTDLQRLTDKPIDRNQLAGNLLNNLIKTLLIYQEKGLSAFMKKWQQFDLTHCQPVNILTATTQFSGIGRGISPEGYFLLENSLGVIQRFSSGDVSLQLSN